MTSPPLVSVVMIFRNEARFLQDAIDSVVAQTFTDWELVLVDDGSSDLSTEIARASARQMACRARFLEHPGHANRGMSASRNLGMQHARGTYLALLDGDDVWRPGKLRRQVSVLRQHPDAGMVYGPTEWWWSWTGRADAPSDTIPSSGTETGVCADGQSFLTGMLRRQIQAPCTCSLLARRDVVMRIGGFEQSFRGMYEDQAFVAKIVLATPVLVDDQCHARYRQHPDSCYATAKATGTAKAARAAFLSWLDTYARRQPSVGPTLLDAIDAERRAVHPPRVAGGLRWLRRAAGSRLRTLGLLSSEPMTR